MGERRIINGAIYEKTPEGIVLIGPAPAAPSMPTAIPLPVNPVRAAREAQDEARKDRSEQRSDASDRRADDAAVRAERTADRADRTANRVADAAAKAANAGDKPTDGQTKSAGFYGRMLQSEGNYGALADADRSPRSLGRQAFRDIAPGMENTFKNSPGRQKADQAIKNFISASLRLESGATIQDSEFNRQYEIFFPSPGDSKEVLAQKAASRRQAIEGFRIAAGPLAEEAAATVTGPKPLGAQIDDQLDSNRIDAQIAAATPQVEGITGKTGDMRDELDPQTSSMVDTMINAKAGAASINAALKKIDPSFSPISQATVDKARAYSKQTGKPWSGSQAVRKVPLTMLQSEAGSEAGAFTAKYLNAATAGIPALLAGAKGRGALDAMGEMHPGQSMAGDIAGGITGTIGAGLGAARVLPAALSRAFPNVAASRLAMAPSVIGDVGYGTAYGFNNAREGEGGMGALKGAAAGLIGNVGGQVVGRGIGALRPGNVSKADKAIYGTVKDNLPEAQANLADAARLNIPYGLVDASPKGRILGGAITRKSGNARDIAERTFDPRQAGQAERAIQAIDANLAPVTNIAERGAMHIDNARTASNPLYAAANARAAPVDEEVAAMLQTPAGQDALARARGIAGNEGRDPNAMGFNLDDQGNVVLQNAPSFETLDMVKQGFDSRLAAARNPVTGQLDLTGNPELGGIERLRQRFVGRLDTLNDQYPAARAAYAEQAQLKNALDGGFEATAPRLTPRDMQATVDNLRPAQVPEFQRGYATNMADQAERARMVSNPYSGIYGSPAQRQKVDMLFPDGAPNFSRVNDLERDMVKTHYETLGGSPTAGRLQADQQLSGGAGAAALDIGLSGGLPIASLLRTGAQAIGDNLKLGMGVKRADEIAPTLFNDNPDEAIAFLNDLIARQAIRAGRQGSAGRLGGWTGAGVLAPLTVGSQN